MVRMEVLWRGEMGIGLGGFIGVFFFYLCGVLKGFVIFGCWFDLIKEWV